MVPFSFTTIATAVCLAALPSASAYIYDMTAPAMAVAGSKVTATLGTAIYIQNWNDFSIIWGLAPASMNCGTDICVGQQIDYTTIYPNNPAPGNFTVDVTIPQGFAAGDYKLVAAIPYLVGASGLTMVHSFNSSITITAA